MSRWPRRSRIGNHADLESWVAQVVYSDDPVSTACDAAWALRSSRAPRLDIIQRLVQAGGDRDRVEYLLDCDDVEGE